MAGGGVFAGDGHGFEVVGHTHMGLLECLLNFFNASGLRLQLFLHLGDLTHDLVQFFLLWIFFSFPFLPSTLSSSGTL
jgi:hypothetical protein